LHEKSPNGETLQDSNYLLSEFAAEGFEKLTVAMDHESSNKAQDAVRAAGIGYIQFAMRAPEQFRLMWRNDLLDGSSPRLQAAIGASQGRFRDAPISAYVDNCGQPPAETILAVRLDLAWPRAVDRSDAPLRVRPRLPSFHPTSFSTAES
jgi:hypothetical protein